MRITYSKWININRLGGISWKQLLDIFNQLLNQMGGKVDLALHQMDELDKNYHLFREIGGIDAFIGKLKEKGLIKEDRQGYRLTPAGERSIRRTSLEMVFSALKKRGKGFHGTVFEGEGYEKFFSETRPYEFGDSVENIDYQTTFKNSLKKGGAAFDVSEEDIEVFEQEHWTNTATVIMIDISHSMILYGEDRITPAKTVALALAEFIMKEFPKDHLDVVLFYDDAKQVRVKDIPYIQVGPYHTNTCAGLALARDILRKRKTVNKQIFMITDGKPTVIYYKGSTYKNSFGHDPLIINRTLDEAKMCKRQNIIITTFMIAQDPYLMGFVEKLTQVNGGRAYYADLENLGSFIISDYVKHHKVRRKR